MKKKYMFDFCIGNPPYQLENSSNGRQPPAYNDFMDAAEIVANVVELITPARFLFNAGQTPKIWNEKKLNDEHFKVLKYEPNGALVFPDTDIKGGLAISIYNHEKNYGKIGTFTVYNELNSIIRKVDNKEKIKVNRLDSVVSSRGNYRTTTTFFSDFPFAKDRLGKGTGNMVASNFFEKLPEISSQKSHNSDDISFLCRIKNKRTIRYINKKYIQDNPYLYTFNVAFPKSNGNGKFGEALTKTEVLSSGEGATDTFISIGIFDTEIEAINLQKYICTKFFRTLLYVKKVTQDNPKSVFSLIPIQDFTDKSDIDWSKSIHEIDLQLYKKYGLSADEIKFIESHVKEMK